MKRLTALALAVLLLLAACRQMVEPQVTTAAPTTTTAPAPSVAQTTTEAPTTASRQGTLYPPLLDYSHHTHENEARYRTVLADLEALGRGERAYAMGEAVGNWKGAVNDFQPDEGWGYNFINLDVSEIDLDGLDWNFISFNSNTLWPETLPQDFDPAGILEYCKNPGLGIRELHDRGIDGTGVGIAIIDHALLLSHEEYRDNLMSYERIHYAGDTAAMHGPAVASIAVGKTVGTAPGSKLYYIANDCGHYEDGQYQYDLTLLADCIYRIIEINETLPENEKIRVISISLGYDVRSPGYDELNATIAQADAQNIFVLTVSPKMYYGFDLMGMDRDYWSDPDGWEGWLPASWLDDFYLHNERHHERLWVPMGSRSYAGCQGDDIYEVGCYGGLSWAVPWLAGFYAMCCQIEPDITPEVFIQLCKETAVTVEIVRGGQPYPMKMVINPAGVIEALEK